MSEQAAAWHRRRRAVVGWAALMFDGCWSAAAEVRPGLWGPWTTAAANMPTLWVRAQGSITPRHFIEYLQLFLASVWAAAVWRSAQLSGPMPPAVNKML